MHSKMQVELMALFDNHQCQFLSRWFMCEVIGYIGPFARYLGKEWVLQSLRFLQTFFLVLDEHCSIINVTKLLEILFGMSQININFHAFSFPK